MSSCFGSGGGGSVPPCVFVWLGKYWQKTCDTQINNHTFCDNNYSTVVTWQQRLLPIHFFELTLETFIPNNIYEYIWQYFNASYHLHHITVKISNRTVSTSHKENADPDPNLKKRFLRVQKGKKSEPSRDPVTILSFTSNLTTASARSHIPISCIGKT